MKINLSSKNFQDWDVGDNYELVKNIGSGSYAFVAQGIQKSTGKKCAIKKIIKLFDDLIDCKRIVREIILLKHLNHPNIVNLLDIIVPPNPKYNEIYIVLEHCQSDLKKLVKSPLHLDMVQINTMLYGILCALKYCHSAEVLHRDLKPANVLVNEDCTVKLCDFGLARSVGGIKDPNEVSSSSARSSTSTNASEEAKDSVASEPKAKPGLQRSKGGKDNKVKRELTAHVVTRWYRPPEVILVETHYTGKVDMWSTGCIFAELLGMMKAHAATFMDRTPLFPGSSCFPLTPGKSKTKKGGMPNEESDQMNVIFSVIGTPEPEDLEFITDSKAVEYIKSFPYCGKVKFSSIYPAAPKEAWDFLEKCLMFNPRKRMSVDEALNHPLLAKVRAGKGMERTCERIKVNESLESKDDLSEEKLRMIIAQEVKDFKSKKPAQ